MADLKYTPPEVLSVLGVVDTYIRWNNKKSRHTRKYTSYHPSEFGHCLRKAQYRRYVEMGLMDLEQKEMDSKLLRLFEKGHNMQSRWERYFEAMGVLRGVWKCKNFSCGAEYGKDNKHGVFPPEKCSSCGCNRFYYNEVSVVNEELNFKGNADIILDFSNFVENKFNGVRQAFNIDNLPTSPIVVDMKTANHDQFKKLSSTGPHQSYVIQQNIYIDILGCDYGLIIYENKNNSEVTAFKIEKDKKMMETIGWQVQVLNEMAKGRHLPPPRPETKFDWDCKKCDFAPHCHKCAIWNDPKLKEKRKNFYKNLL